MDSVIRLAEGALTEFMRPSTDPRRNSSNSNKDSSSVAKDTKSSSGRIDESTDTSKESVVKNAPSVRGVGTNSESLKSNTPVTTPITIFELPITIIELVIDTLLSINKLCGKNRYIRWYMKTMIVCVILVITGLFIQTGIKTVSGADLKSSEPVNQADKIVGYATAVPGLFLYVNVRIPIEIFDRGIPELLNFLKEIINSFGRLLVRIIKSLIQSVIWLWETVSPVGYEVSRFVYEGLKTIVYWIFIFPFQWFGTKVSELFCMVFNDYLHPYIISPIYQVGSNAYIVVGQTWTRYKWWV